MQLTHVGGTPVLYDGDNVGQLDLQVESTFPLGLILHVLTSLTCHAIHALHAISSMLPHTKHSTNCSTVTTNTVLWPLCSQPALADTFNLRTGGFRWCKVLLPHALADNNQRIPVREKTLHHAIVVVHATIGEDAGVLLNSVIYIVSVQYNTNCSNNKNISNVFGPPNPWLVISVIHQHPI